MTCVPKFLTKDYPIDRHLFLVPRFALRIIGFYPESEKSVWLLGWAFLNIALLAYGCYAELYYGIYYIPIDVPTALDAICPVLSSIMSLLKIFFIWWYRPQFKLLIERVRELTEAHNSPENLRVKRTYFTVATQLTCLMLFFGFCTSTSYSIRTILNNTLRYLNGKDIIYETPFKMMLPKIMLRMPLYPLSFVLVHWHGYVTVVSFVGGDGFFLGFCFYFATLLKGLKFDVESLLDSESPEVNRRNEKEVCHKLAKIIERHNEIAELTRKLSVIMANITLSHFVTSSIIIGTSIVDMLLFSGYGVVVYVVYTCAVLTEILLYCLGGTAVAESSHDISVAVYCTRWYSYSVRVQKMVLLLMVRAQRPFVIKVPFFTPSLPALTSILRFTGSLIALANTIIK